MALIKNVTNREGVTYNYHRLENWHVSYNLDHSVRVRALLSSYLNKATRDADNHPIARSNIVIDLPADTADLSITQSYLYDQILKLPEWSDATTE